MQKMKNIRINGHILDGPLLVDDPDVKKTFMDASGQLRHVRSFSQAGRLKSYVRSHPEGIILAGVGTFFFLEPIPVSAAMIRFDEAGNADILIRGEAESIEKQLEAGFRYLDIRLGDGENGLKLMHGFTSCTKGPWPWSSALMLSDVLKECYDFLDAHPTEFIVFCVKHEHGDSSESAFHEALMAELEKDPGRWYFGASLPTVGEARGRLVLLRRTGSPDAAGISFDWHDQGGFEDASKNTELNTNHNCSVYVQDRYEYEAEEKWSAFIAGMEGSEASSDTAALNFLSTKGNAKYGHPFKYAVPLNKKLLELEGESISGWVIVDFASATLAEHIYKNNF